MAKGLSPSAWGRLSLLALLVSGAGCQQVYSIVGEEAKVTPDPTAAPTPKCTRAEPVIGKVEPVELWHWAGWSNSATNVSYRITYSSPVAGDLLNDGKVRIVSVPSTGDYTNTNGPIVVLDGATGNVEWNSMEGASPFGLMASTTPAILDLDGDGAAEIIGVAWGAAGAKEILIVDYKKRVIRARQPTTCPTFCSSAVADVDGDGKAEIIAGNTVLNSDGTVKMVLPGTGGVMKPTIAKLLPGTSGLQFVLGSQVFSNQGKLVWSAAAADACAGRAFTAVGDLARDGQPELICSGGGFTYLYEFDASGQGSLSWKKPIPRSTTEGSNLGGAPNIGAFLGNGQLQFGLAGGDYYLVYDVRGTEIWKQATLDHSSSSTGSTVFDLNGDGKVEVLYNDETKLRIYNGADGQILWSTANPSGTLWEYPLIVDLNGDKSADIVVSSPALGGVRTFTDPTKKWVNTRTLWNQYSYIGELVSEKLTAVASPAAPDEGFRVNRKGTLPTGELVCQ